MTESGFSTFELPIRKLLKLIFIIGAVGILIGIAISAAITNATGILKPDATSILLNSFVAFHATYPLILLAYAGFGGAVTLVVYLDKKSREQAKKRRIAQTIAAMEQYGGE